MSRPRLLSVFAALIAIASVLAACGGGGSDDPQSVVDEATLEGVESGKIDLDLALGIKGGKGGHVDVSLTGPFQSEGDAELPELDLSLAVKGSLDGEGVDREAGITLLPGNKAYLAYEGTEYEVDSTTFNFVKSMLKQRAGGQDQSSEVTACQDAASGIELDTLVDDLKDEGSADVGGTSTSKVSGNLNPGGTVDAFSQIIDDPVCNEQLKATGQLPSAGELDKAKDTVRHSLKAAHVDLYVGDDHIIRRIVSQATIEPPKSSDAGARRIDLDLDLTLTGVNEAQAISAPGSAKPLSNLFLKLGINPIELLGAFQNGAGSGGLGGLLEGLNGGGGSSSGGGDSGSGRQSYYECLGEAQTPVDIQDCTGLLQ